MTAVSRGSFDKLRVGGCRPFDRLRANGVWGMGELGPFDKLRSFDKLRTIGGCCMGELGPFDKLRANGVFGEAILPNSVRAEPVEARQAGPVRAEPVEAREGRS